MVHVIPILVGERRLDTGNAVQYPDSSPVGGALQQLGDHWQAVAERYEQRMVQQRAFDTEIAARRLNGEIARAEADAVANAPADGAGLHDAMYGQVDPFTGKVVKTGLFDTLFGNFLKQAPPELRPGLAARKEALRAAGSLRMAQQQLQRRDDYEWTEWRQVENAYTSSIAQSDPKDTANYEAIRQSGLDLIAKIGSPLARHVAETAWKSNAAKALVQALIAQDPKRAAEMLGAGPMAGDGMGETVRMQLAASERAAAKGDWRRNKTPDEVIAQAFRDDLPQEERAALARQAQAADAARQIELRTNLGLAEQNAPDDIARTGVYSGKMPGRDAFRIAYGPDEGDERFRDFDWRADVGRQVYGMQTMTNREIHAALRDADSGPSISQEDQDHRTAIAVAAELAMKHRRVDAGGYVSEALPEIAAAWKAVIGGGLEDPNGYDKDAYDKAVAMTIAAQEHLGIENPQPVPQSFLRVLSDNHDSKSSYQQDINAKIGGLLAGTSGPVARAAVARQLADADLGWIMPVESGYRPMSTRAVLASQAKGLGKSVANAGIGAAELAADAVALAADGNSQARISLPDFSGAYYRPANRVENLAMQQGSDALSWAIPWPAFRPSALTEKGIPRTIESSAIAAEHAEGLIANRRPVELAQEGEALVGGVDAETLRYQQGLASFAFRPVPKSERAFDNAMLAAMLARDPDTVKYAGAKLGIAESEDYRKTFFGRNPQLKKSENVVHHAGEKQAAKRYPSIVDKAKINSYENLRGIPKGFDRVLHKKVLRFEWDEFYKQNPNFTEGQWLDKITEIDKKYGHLFDPPVGE
ncbi:hypothetical protein RFM26_24665 [Mesorhizobium sp. VK23B]|uniref:Uncharacterized protein n=1 Tax=Mesorhizobium dulcispinae TaxID=3072316 RepID=A0ABU4XKP1_9HYPH|nr:MULTISPECIES: hypothetical protein [unclassified Mesorhizobium]MDX8468906.1 hypothetical protein [Mesorhizobium sp. VK23B]MDX8475305.1 hypothetical protein [Mesorhizobium sp. VK23A]